MESRPKPKHLPWRSWAEWKSVYTTLRSDPQAAIEVMRVWQLRKSLPVRVELTLNILVLRQDQGLDTAALTETGRAAFGLCVLRGVNLLTGLEQKAKNAMSIMGLAKEIGLPEYLVDLRHNVAHGSMPAAELLQTAVEALWTWLLDNYWDEQYNQLQGRLRELEERLESYSQKAKNLKSHELLYEYLAKHFSDPRQDRAYLQKWLVAHHSVLYDEAWATACLYFNSVVPKFAEGIIQEALAILPRKFGEVRTIVEETLALCEDLKLTVTPQLKRVLVQANTDTASRELLELLQGALQTSTSASCSLLLQFTQDTQVSTQQVAPVELPKWKKANYWTPRPIGSNSVFKSEPID
jgi:hypothetical protein